MAVPSLPAHADRPDTAIEKFIGQQVANALRDGSGVDRDPLLAKWVQRIGGDVAARSPRGDVTCRFEILGTDTANALAAPGGFIFVTRGLLDSVDSEDELAGILAHETAHVAKRHAMQQIGANLVFILLINGVKADRDIKTAASVYSILRTLHKSREMEAQADEVGFGFTTAAGYDPRGLVHFFERIATGSKESRLERLFETHPSPEERIRSASTRPLTLPAIGDGYARRGLIASADLARRGGDPLVLPPPVAAPVGAPAYVAEGRAEVQKRTDALGKGFMGAYRGQKIGDTLQQLLLINANADYRWLFVAYRAYEVQTRVEDIYSRSVRVLRTAPGTYDALANFADGPYGAEASLGRAETIRALERLDGARLPLGRASQAAATVLADLNNRFYHPKGDAAWLRYGSLEGLLRYAESELARADKASGEAWRLLAFARIRRYQIRTDQIVAGSGEPGRALWTDLLTRRLELPPSTILEGPAGPATVRAMLAIERAKPASEIEAGRGDTPWADWTLKQGGVPENIATALRLLTLDLERETAARNQRQAETR